MATRSVIVRLEAEVARYVAGMGQAAQATDNVAVFSIDPKTGQLGQVGRPSEILSPVCVKFLAVE